MEDLIEKVKQILVGIDAESCDRSKYVDGKDVSWWETSTGAEFGKQKLEEVTKAIEEACNGKMV